MKRLFRYIGAEVALYASFTLLILISLFSFFDLLREIDDIGKGGYRFIDVVIYVLFEIPSHAYELLPVAVLIGGIYALSTLASNSELTVMRVSGVSMMRLTGWLAVIGVLFALLTALLGEYVAPAASRAAQGPSAKPSPSVSPMLSGTRKPGSRLQNCAHTCTPSTMTGCTPVRRYALKSNLKS